MCWQILSLVFAALAAGLWGWSAFVRVPAIGSGYGTLVTVLKDGSTVNGTELFSAALAKISRLNAGAAACAFLSAAFQAVSLYMTRAG
jgi:transaldolase